MKKILSLFALVLCVAVVFCGCDSKDSDSSQSNNSSKIVTTTTLPGKKSLSAEEFKSALENVSSLNFKMEIVTDENKLKIFPYDGLKSAVKVNVNNSDVAIYYVFENDKQAKKVIEDARSMNYSNFDEEKGSNYDKLWQNSAVVEQVDNTLLTIADIDQNVTSQIINATKY